jgi:hypothetical protein
MFEIVFVTYVSCVTGGFNTERLVNMFVEFVS